MASKPLPRRLAAILYADVTGYSRLMSDDERATVETLNSYRDIGWSIPQATVFWHCSTASLRRSSAPSTCSAK